jgi:hypothetical protein
LPVGKIDTVAHDICEGRKSHGITARTSPDRPPCHASPAVVADTDTERQVIAR